MAIDLNYLEKNKEHVTEKKVFVNPYKDILEAYEVIENNTLLVPEEFIAKHTFNVKEK